MMRRLRPALWIFVLCAACQWMAPTHMSALASAAASVPGVSCNANITSISFGNIDSNGIQGNYNLNTTGYLTYYCTNTTSTPQTITACFSIGNPGSATQRSLTGPDNPKLNYQLFQDAAATQPWGSKSSPGTWGNPYAANVTIPANGSSAPATAPIYAVIAGNQGSFFGFPLGWFLLPAGDYSASYGSGDVMLDLAPGANAACSVAAGGGTITGFQVSANVQQTCQVTTNPLTFPSPGAGNPSGVTASTTLTVTCTSHTGYQVGLDNGKNYDGSNRRMRGGPTHGNYISYGLYQNSGATVPWGNTAGTNTVTGTSSTQTFTVYGKINANQGLPEAGDYFDAVTVYVYY